MENTNSNGTLVAQTLTLHKDFKGLYSAYRLQGHRGSVNITNKLFPGGVAPASIQVIGLLEATDAPVTGDVDKAAAKAAKAQEKAEKAQKKAEDRAAKAQAIAEKAKAAAELAVQRAAKATAAVATPAAEPGAEQATETPAAM